MRKKQAEIKSLPTLNQQGNNIPTFYRMLECYLRGFNGERNFVKVVRDRRSARVVESASLERTYVGNGIKGSNPFSSAKFEWR